MVDHSEVNEGEQPANGLSRRTLLTVSALSALGVSLRGLSISDESSQGKKPPAEPSTTLLPPGKDLHVLTDRPLNAEALLHHLDAEVTPNEHLFVRNNGILPEIAYGKGLDQWTLTIDGEVDKPLTLSLKDLQSGFTSYTYQLVLECGGNGRAGYYPPPSGLQFTYGGVGCPQWTGVRLKDVLEAAGVRTKKAVYVAYQGHDLHPSLDPNKHAISRGFPLRKALEDTTLIALQLNGKPLPPEHGFPARVICPGFPASASGKWLKRLWIRDIVHDGEKMLGSDYRVPKYPVAPGTSVPDSDMEIIEEMPVKSLITFPASGSMHGLSKDGIGIRGFAWCGKGSVKQVDVTYDYGQTWHQAKLKEPANPFAWQRWEIAVKLPKKGYYEIMARAMDHDGILQPMVVAGWNPKGYLNNAMPRIALTLTA